MPPAAMLWVCFIFFCRLSVSAFSMADAFVTVNATGISYVAFAIRCRRKPDHCKLGWMLFSATRVLRSFSPFSSSITRPDLTFALKFLLCLNMVMKPFIHTDFSIPDSLKYVRKSVLIYETIIIDNN